MARPKSEDRRSALLDAATEIFAESGLAAPTAAISKRAGVSEGSFFTYFKTKDELLIALYRDLRLQLADAVMNAFPRRGSVRERLAHIWERYVTWGVKNRVARKALRLVSMSPAIMDEVRAESSVLFAEIDQLEADALEQKKMKLLPPRMSGAVLKALAEMTMDLIDRDPKRAAKLRAAGFELLWGALSR